MVFTCFRLTEIFGLYSLMLYLMDIQQHILYSVESYDDMNWKGHGRKRVVTYFKSGFLTQQSPGGTGEKLKNTLRLVVPTKIRTRHFPITSQNHCHLSQLTESYYYMTASTNHFLANTKRLNNNYLFT
jgi:hypothetical protein